MSQNPINKNLLNETLKRTLFDQFQPSWKSEVSNSPKGLSYGIFKETFGFENYLDKLSTRESMFFCRFRTSNHKLPIETGRWQNLQRNERKYNCFDKNYLGDEFH